MPLVNEFGQVETYKGIGLPDTENKFPHYKTEQDLIQDSVLTILFTKQGQRLFAPDFGSKLWSVVFSPSDTITERLTEENIINALRTWEPRIRVQKVNARAEDDALFVQIEYLILKLSKNVLLRLDISRSDFTLRNVQ